MTAREDIESFLAELRKEGVVTGPVEPLMRWLLSSDHPAAVKFCDSICAVIRQKELTLKERASHLRPILIELLDLFAKPH
jgi:hypothetical protein